MLEEVHAAQRGELELIQKLGKEWFAGEDLNEEELEMLKTGKF